MKKILGISLVAVLAATPLIASAAAGDPTQETGTVQLVRDAQENVVEPAYALAQTGLATDANFATAGYVKGAYNAAIKAINTVDSIKQDTLSATNQLNPTYIATDNDHSFVTSTEKTTWSGKQNALNEGQIAAVNSGITATDKAAYDAYATNKQDTLTTAQLAAVNSGLTSSDKTALDNLVTNSADYATQEGVENKIKAATGSVDNTKISTTGTVAVPTKAKYSVMESWGSDTPTDKLLALSDSQGTVVESNGQITATTTITAGAVSIDPSSVDYEEANSNS